VKTERISGIITALSPIHHGGDEKTGAIALLRRGVWIVDSEPVEVPYIEGNAIRGMLRRLVMQDLLERVRFKPTQPRLYHTLFSGGVLEEVTREAVGRLDLDLRRRIRVWLPALSLWGGAIANQAVRGKLIVGKALPICRELNNYLPIKSEISIHTYLMHSFFTRRAEREPELAEDVITRVITKSPEVPEGAEMEVVEVDGEKVKKRREMKKKEEPTVQMLVELECFAPGTRFYHWFTLLDTTPLEESCFAHALDLWRQRPYLGGRAAVGMGEVSLSYEIPYSSEAYLAFLEERKNEILDCLIRLDQV